MSAKNAKRTEKHKVTIAEATRDVVIASMNKGQLPLVFVGFYVLVILIRVPDHELVSFLRKFAFALKDYCYWGYILSILITFGWFFSARMMRKMHSEECHRIGKEKSSLQEKLLGVTNGEKK